MRNDYADIIRRVLEKTLNEKNIKNAVNMIMAELGEFYDLSRIYVFEHSDDDKTMDNTYEWCNINIEPLMTQRQGYPTMDIFKGRIERVLVYDDVKALKNIIDDRYNLFDDSKICSIMIVPIVDNKVLTGFIGFEDNSRYGAWTEDKIKNIKFIAKMISQNVLKIRSDVKYYTEKRINSVIMECQKICSYAVDPETNEIIYIGNLPSYMQDSVEKGNVCYRALYGKNSMCKHCPMLSIRNNSDEANVRFFDKRSMSYLNMTATKMRWHDGKDVVLISYSDISQYVEQAAHVDSLTGAPTLNKFSEDAKHLLDKVRKKYGYNYVIAYMDISKFKYINETFGYSDGDSILKILSECIKKQIREYECYCRATDDKFIILMRYDMKVEIRKRLDDLFNRVNANRLGAYINLDIVFICGLYFIKPDDFELNYIIDKANIARKNVKGNMESRCEVYDDEMHQKISKQKIIESRMVKALADKEFVVYIQPKNRLDNGEVIGAEALVRWRQSDGSIVPPNEFIPVFENNGFIVDLDFYVYERVFEYIGQWLASGIKAVPVSVNVSRAHINNTQFVSKLVKLVKKCGIPMEYVELELTESIFTDDNESVINTMMSLKDLGFKLLMDDFGSAYSSLNLLKELPFDIIKLDKEFLHYNYGDNRDKTIIIHVIEMSKDLNMEVICEGVETKEQVEFLKEAGCDFAQGYYYGKPCPEEEFRSKFLLGNH
ncbi:MAG: GGDEF domain-containing protein [Firmicutes bacterium]|nr:GGDEF domain-containing protein [Bacillota bacterium]